MIYSAAFDAMPDAAKAAIYWRLWHVLSGMVRGDKYQRQSLADRRAIVEILRDPKPDLAACFGSDPLNPDEEDAEGLLSIFP